MDERNRFTCVLYCMTINTLINKHIFALLVFVCVWWCPAHVVLSFVVLYIMCCQFLWMVEILTPLRYSLTYIFHY